MAPAQMDSCLVPRVPESFAHSLSAPCPREAKAPRGWGMLLQPHSESAIQETLLCVCVPGWLGLPRHSWG